MKNYNRIKGLASLALVSIVGLNILQAERQVQVWVNPGMNAPDDMKAATGLDQLKIHYEIPLNAEGFFPCLRYRDIESGINVDTYANIDTLKLSGTDGIHDGTITAIPNQGFVLTENHRGVSKQVDLIDALKQLIHNEIDRFQGVTVNALAGGGGGSFLHKMSELQQDLAAINSIPPTNHPRGIAVFRNVFYHGDMDSNGMLNYQRIEGKDKLTIVLFLNTNPDIPIHRNAFAGAGDMTLPKDLVVMKLSRTLLDNLWRLAL